MERRFGYTWWVATILHHLQCFVAFQIRILDLCPRPSWRDSYPAGAAFHFCSQVKY